MKHILLTGWIVIAGAWAGTAVGAPPGSATGPAPQDREGRPRVIFATFAESQGQMNNAVVLVESLRAFGGALRNAPVWIHVSTRLGTGAKDARGRLEALGAEIREGQSPPEAQRFYYAGKVFAASQAEAQAQGRTDVLVWMDDDTVILEEPGEFVLNKEAALGYRPVMHKNVGTLFSDPLDDFWSRLFEKFSVTEAAFFPMVTTASAETIRPYFNAGIIAVRPERGLMRTWAEFFATLCADPVFAAWAEKDVKKNIFLHQAALTAAILRLFARKDMVELSDRINYPLFFHEKWEAARAFTSIEDAVTIRYEIVLRDQPAGWEKKLSGPKDKIAWLKQHLSAGR